MPKEFKSISDHFRERLERENRIHVMDPDTTFELITSFNREMAETEASIKFNEIEAEKELGGIPLTM